ncbi:MAG: type IV pilus twitching motility protein PilT [Chloroflexota bacterium]
MDIDELLKRMVDKRASDAHLRVPSPPILRIDGELVPQEDLPRLTPNDMTQALEKTTSPEQRETFFREHELDFAYGIPGVSRFRVSCLQQRGTLSLAFRLVSFEAPDIDKLGLPPICKTLALKPRGLLLVTGRTGSGKSTTLAAMINYLNETVKRNIITIEDPIEFLFHNKNCIIAQRELGSDTKSFAVALRHALRHDPDVIVVGEMRDLDTISIAITAAETGHLVLGTLHTSDAPQTVDRIIDIFPPAQQQQIRLQFSQVIEAVISQALLPRATGKGRIAAFEILMGTSPVRNLIREGKTFELANAMQLGSRDGMQTLNQALADLVKKGLVTQEEALTKSSSPERLLRLIQFSSG